MSKINPDYLAVLEFDKNLQVGQECAVHWTNSGRYFNQRGTVAKINAKSVRVALTADYLGYRKGQEIIVPRASSVKQWTWNNGVTPIQLPTGVAVGMNSGVQVKFSTLPTAGDRLEQATR